MKTRGDKVVPELITQQGSKQQNDHFPKVVIGMPIYNESRFLKDTLSCLKNQDYPNLEILISDNASTDDTQNICQAFVSECSHAHYHRFDENQGASINFNYVFDASDSDYFMWAAGHDLWSPNYISDCVKLLEQHPSSVIAFGSSKWIDEHGAAFAKESGWSDTRGLSIQGRYVTVLWGNMHPIYGLIRRTALANDPMEHLVGADLILLTSLILKGDFLHAPRALWSRREFRNAECYGEKLQRYTGNDYQLVSRTFDRLFPLAKLPIALMQVIWASDLKLQLRIALMMMLGFSFPFRYLASRYN